MRVGFISRDPQPHSIYPQVGALLLASGVAVEMLAVDHDLLRMNDLVPSADLYVLRARTLPAFSASLVMNAAGARFLIPLERERVVGNRVLTQQTLAKAGIPAPPGWLIGSLESLARLVRDRGSVVTKPLDVASGKGVRFIHSPDEVPSDLCPPLFAQKLVPHASADIKVYGIGSRVWAIRRRFPAENIDEKRGTPVEPTADMLKIAHRCRDAFGLELYGVDLLETADGLVVVDVNSTPGYKGIPGAAESIADLIRESLLERP